jgi:hypothetical protein
MAALFVAISRHLALLPAVCMSPPGCLSSTRCLADSINSFAFVEYESRRDADEAYHEMHNKRIGRDDLLKIEVSKIGPIAPTRNSDINSGLELLHQHLGASTLAVIANAALLVVVLLAEVVVVLLRVVAVGTTLLARTIVGIATMIAGTVIVPAAQTIGKLHHI